MHDPVSTPVPVPVPAAGPPAAAYRTVADVLLFLPLAQTFSYGIPEALEDRVERGVQVLCPVRNRGVAGLVMSVRPPEPADPVLSPLSGLVGARRPWPADLLRLLEWVSSYYVAPVGVVARTAMPSLFLRRVPAPVQLVRIGREPDRPARSARMKALLDRVRSSDGVELSDLRRQVPGGTEIVRRMLGDGLLRIDLVDRPVHAPEALPPPGPAEALDLTPEQAIALDRIIAGLETGYGAFLLHGVTGSGKTEVYLRAIEAVVSRGRGAIVLVPEIALTIEIRRRFEERFGPLVTVLHSAMPEARRAEAWDGLLSGRVRIAVGPRSAVFAPVRDLGLIVVDEEHETTFKQEEGLRYNARDMAMVRAKLAACPVVLGSATPSLETFQLAHDGKVAYLQLPKRVRERPMPSIRFVDLRYEPPLGTERLFSASLLEALATTVARGESAILFLNRRGFGRFLLCRACGQPLRCPNCSIAMTHHVRPERLTCHYCDHTRPVPEACPGCGSSDVDVLGFGTERVEEEVARLVPGVRAVRLDSDTSSAGALDRILQAFRKGEYNVLVGTQIVAKGHDFPSVTLVGVLLAEQSLAFPDFRAAERTFQILTQVAGRAGRGDMPGAVIVQTYDPDQYALRFAATHDFLGFAVTENRGRRERGYPPHAYLAAVEVSGTDGAAAEQLADRVRDYLDQFAALEPPGDGRITLLGPAKAAIERIKGRSRFQILLKSRSRSLLNRVLWRLSRTLPRDRTDTRVIIDVDPVNML